MSIHRPWRGRAHLEAIRLASCQRPPEAGLQLATDAIRECFRQGPPQHLRTVAPEEQLRGSIEVGEAQLRIEGIEAVANAVEDRAQSLRGGDQRAFGGDLAGRLDDDRQHPGRFAVLAMHGAVTEIEVGVLCAAVTFQNQVRVLVRQRFAGQYASHHLTIELGDLGPGLQYRHAQAAGVMSTSDDRVGIVVDHHALRSPEQRHRQRRAQQGIDGDVLAGRPLRDRAQRGRRPVEIGDARLHVRAVLGADRRRSEFRGRLHGTGRQGPMRVCVRQGG